MSQKEPEIIQGYWPRMRRWVDVPLFYVPQGAVTNDGLQKYRFIPCNDLVIFEASPRRANRACKKFITNESIITRNWSEKELNQFCRVNDISFFWLTGRSSTIKTRRKGQETRQKKDRKARLLNAYQCRKILKELRKINVQSSLIVEILFFHNNRLEKLGGYITLEEILRAKVCDVFSDLKRGSHFLNLSRTTRGSTHRNFLNLPAKIWKPLHRRADKGNFFVFSNKYGEPFLSSQIDKHLRTYPSKTLIQK